MWTIVISSILAIFGIYFIVKIFRKPKIKDYTDEEVLQILNGKTLSTAIIEERATRDLPSNNKSLIMKRKQKVKR